MKASRRFTPSTSGLTVAVKNISPLQLIILVLLGKAELATRNFEVGCRSRIFFHAALTPKTHRPRFVCVKIKSIKLSGLDGKLKV